MLALVRSEADKDALKALSPTGLFYIENQMNKRLKYLAKLQPRVKQPLTYHGRLTPVKRKNLNHLPEETTNQFLKRGGKIIKIK